MLRALDRCSPIKPTISYSSPKNGRWLYCESTSERDALLGHEFDPTVIAFVTQPVTYSYVIGGKPRVYTPDTLVIRHPDADGPKVFFEEIKPEGTQGGPDFDAKFNLLGHLFVHKVRAPLVVRFMPPAWAPATRTNNQRYLYPALGASPNIDLLHRLQETSDSLTFGEAKSIAMKECGTASAVLPLLAHQLLAFDWDATINDATRLEVSR
ncbi:Tn7 transposase TnsA N-terminal domain-containing protein [Methylonatrum kenyense]|uniref:Tn7 transposase TnsA N-terminal domain-containing protein n=1 Tax=Methylonatrum kenyense TaxID=455253 RepID=UPI0020BE099F|nr:Tn7 transposase TnsA N-terminal domain-containing protein [Methylonatrum kenyense]MCK8515858.1 Tn7 transposase TnsA N-terminal domain-containing protein [Methylonatrum kenyense]